MNIQPSGQPWDSGVSSLLRGCLRLRSTESIMVRCGQGPRASSWSLESPRTGDLEALPESDPGHDHPTPVKWLVSCGGFWCQKTGIFAVVSLLPIGPF